MHAFSSATPTTSTSTGGHTLAAAKAADRLRQRLRAPQALTQDDLPAEVQDFFRGAATPDLAAVADWAVSRDEPELLQHLVTLGFSGTVTITRVGDGALLKVAAQAGLPVRLPLTESINAGNVGALIDLFQTPQAQVTDLHLPLSGHLAAGGLSALATLLGLLDRHAALSRLHVQVLDSDPPSEEMLFALAGSTACLVLGGASVRPLLVCGIDNPSELQAFALEDFLSDEAIGTSGPAVMLVQVASKLAQLALDQGKDALLRAVTRLSPWFALALSEVPAPDQLERLVRCGCPASLSRSVTTASLPETLDLLAHPSLAWVRLDLTIQDSLPDDALAELGAGILNCDTAKQMTLNVAPHVVLGSPSLEPHRRWPARPDTVRLHLLGAPGAGVTSCLVALAAGLRPLSLWMKCDQPAQAAIFLQELSSSAAASGIETLHVTCNQPDAGFDMAGALATLMSSFKRVQEIVIISSSLVAHDSVLALQSSAHDLLPLNQIRLIPGGRGRGETIAIGLLPALRIRQGKFQRAYFVGSSVGFFQTLNLPADAGHLFGTSDLLDARSHLALATTHQAAAAKAADYRRHLQGMAIAEALINEALGLGVLHEMLLNQQGEIDEALVDAVRLRLQSVAQRDGASDEERTRAELAASLLDAARLPQ